MGIRINQNIFSLLVTRNLNRVTDRLEDTLQRLSSGQRINKAGDDPAGLSISNTIRHEIRGLQQNVRNAGDAISVTSTAESAMGEVTNILQRLRELAVQSSNATLSTQNREALQVEMDNLILEINRVANSTEFNGRALLNGANSSAKIQIGTQGSQFITVQLPDIRTSMLGLQAVATGMNSVNGTAIVNPGDLTINNIDVPASVSDGLGTAQDSSSAIAKATAINAISTQTGVTARAEPTEFTVAGSIISPVSLDGIVNSLTINGVNIGTVTVGADDAAGTLRQAINDKTDQTGVSAALNAAGELVLTAEDGRNIELTTTGLVAETLGLANPGGGPSDLAGLVQTAQVTLTSDTTINVGGTLALIGFDPSQAVIAIDPNTALSFLQIADESLSRQALETIDRTLAQVLARRADLGSIQNRLESSVRSISQQIVQLSASNQRILDTDFAQETARLAQLQILQEAGIAILAQANLMPRIALNLLQNGR